MKNLILFVLVTVLSVGLQAQPFNYNKNLKSKIEKRIRSDKNMMNHLKSLPTSGQNGLIDRLSNYFSMSPQDQSAAAGICLSCLLKQGYINQKEQDILEKLLSESVFDNSYLMRLKSGKYSSQFASFIIPYIADLYYQENSGSRRNVYEGEVMVSTGKWGRAIGALIGAIGGAIAMSELGPAGSLAGAAVGAQLGAEFGDAASGVMAREDGKDCQGFPKEIPFGS